MVYKDIEGVDVRYKAGSDGHIYSFFKGHPVKLSSGLSSNKKYLHVSVLLSCGKRVSRDVHKLICKAFHGEPNSRLYQVAHKDGCGTNNLPSNLMWCHARENLRHKFLHGTHDSGTNNSRASLSKEGLFVCRWLLCNTVLTQKEIADILNVRRGVVVNVSNCSRYGNVEVSVVESVSYSTVGEVV